MDDDEPDYWHSDWEYASLLAKFENVSIFCSKIQFGLVITVIVINLFHLITLSQKSLRSNAINILLIGIAISDLIFLLHYLRFEVLLLLQAGIDESCIPPPSYLQVLLQLITSYSRDIFRRVSSWLGVIMALIRAIAIRYPTNQRVQGLIRPLRSFQLILSVTLISFLVSSLNWAKVRISERKEKWVPGENCDMFRANTSIPQYHIISLSLAGYTSLITELFLLLDGVLKLAPPLVYPFLAGILVFELKNAQNRRRKLTTSSRTDNSDKDTDNTTKVVVWMSISYFIAEAPTGMAYIFQFLFFGDMGVIYFITAITIPFITILIIHCAFNFFICLLLNSQYRTTVKSLFGFGDKKLVKSRSITVTSQGSMTANFSR